MTLVIKRSDRFPVGQLVKAYKSIFNTHAGVLHPTGPEIGSAQMVATDGSLTFTAVNAGEGVVLYAEVNSEERMIRCAGREEFVPPPTGLVARIEARKAASGLVF